MKEQASFRKKAQRKHTNAAPQKNEAQKKCVGATSQKVEQHHQPATIERLVSQWHALVVVDLLAACHKSDVLLIGLYSLAILLHLTWSMQPPFLAR